MLHHVVSLYGHTASNSISVMVFRMFSFGEFKQEDQDKMLDALNKKVADVYAACIGQNEANIR